ncbi:MAG: hypothetical protein AAGI53_02370 [Planctomycetota bacterium]
MGTPVLPIWLTAPLGAALMLLVAGHVIAMHRGRDVMQPSRRRIRTTNGVVALLLTPLLVYAFSIVTPAQQRPFIFAWLTSMALLGITLLLAAIDMFNNARLGNEARVKMREELEELKARTRALLDEQTAHNPPLKLTGDEPERPHDQREDRS